MLFPSWDLRVANFPVAQIFLPNGHVELIKVKLLKGLPTMFYVKPWGFFRLDPKKRVTYQKTAMYYYDVRSANPIDPFVLTELIEFAKKNKLAKITRKDVQQGIRIRQKVRKGLEKDTAIEQIRKELKITAEQLNQAVIEINTLAQDEKNVRIPRDYALIDNLEAKSLIDSEQAMLYKTKLENSEINFEQLLIELEQLNFMSVNTPLSISAELFLDDYHTYPPSEVITGIQLSRIAGKKFESLSAGAIKPVRPIIAIAIAFLIGIIGIQILAGTDLSNIAESLPSLPPFLGGE